MKLRLAALALLLLVAGAGYVASPFVAAYGLRQAIKTGDVATIARKIDWSGVRASLRDSISEHAQLKIAAVEAGRAVPPTLWQRLKSAFGSSMLDRFIETYVTPEGLPKLYAAKHTWNEDVRGRPNEDAMPWRERLKRFAARVKRAEFQGLARVEVEMADQFSDDRHYISVLALEGFEWKLVSLRVVRPGATMATRLMAAN